MILIGDFNSVPSGGRTGSSLPFSYSIRKADDSLHDFCQGTGGILVFSRYHSWSRGKQRAALDNAVTWNYHLFCPKVCPFEARHKSYNHRVLSFAALVEDFITTFKASKQNFNIPIDRVNVFFLKDPPAAAQ